MLFGRLTPVVDARPDGVTYVRAAEPLPPHADTWIDRLEHWARVAPDRPFLAERDGAGGWRTLTYADALDQTMRIGSWLLAHGASAERPLLILSGNSIEHGLLSLGGMAVNAPTCPVSTAYSLISQDLGKLKGVIDLLTPSLAFASDATAYARALALAKSRDIGLITGEASPGATPFSALLATPVSAQARAARAALTPDSIGKFLLTSGSTGHPKAVINTQRMMCASHAMLREALPFFKEEPPVLVEWLPWAHTFGSNSSFGLILYNGGTFYIDEGRPTPAGIATTVNNLREIAPTIFFNVPKGFEELLPHLQNDAALRRTFFSRTKMLFYAGAGLSLPIFEAYRELSARETGQPLPWTTSLGSTETGPGAVVNVRGISRPGLVGVPHRGVELKLVPNGAKLELRLRGPNITPGYWRRPDLTQDAFDEEGFYKIGDALKLAEPGNWDAGFVFDGRVSEDFKLATGTWVSVGPLRIAFLNLFEPLAQDVVIAGQDRDDVGALVFPNFAALAQLAPGLSPEAAVRDPRVKAAFAEKLRAMAAGSTGSSTKVTRLALMTEPPSIDRGEVTDKGSLNQRLLLVNRKADVDALYAAAPGENQVRL
ncbi:MAG: feruloyl-CoA synthase [Pseudomonadota bacterium]|nr:feruloyl-CoA synthase [Pseudomonadota bacterium]